MTRALTVLGSTGSIGTQSLDVARRHGIRVAALSAGRNIELLERQIREFRPAVAAVESEAAGKDLRVRVADTGTKVIFGEGAAVSAAEYPESDTVLNAVVGIAGLRPTLAALSAGKDVALANKESLVAGGELVTEAAKRSGRRILPVDSEHSAIFQCLQGVPAGALKKILLTCSGGPFYGRSREELAVVTAKEALRHPNWNMGAKITVDCATLINKGLEVIEAVRLFGVAVRDIEVLIHRQSVVHSAVELRDGAVIAQLGAPDMRLPIQYALCYPDRLECAAPSLDLKAVGTLTFEEPDYDAFPGLRVMIGAGAAGGLKPAAASGANERAVRLFLEGKIPFPAIAELVAGAVEEQPAVGSCTLEDVLSADRAAGEFVARAAGVI